jgi:hypothetical protein
MTETERAIADLAARQRDIDRAIRRASGVVLGRPAAVATAFAQAQDRWRLRRWQLGQQAPGAPPTPPTPALPGDGQPTEKGRRFDD